MSNIHDINQQGYFLLNNKMLSFLLHAVMKVATIAEKMNNPHKQQIFGQGPKKNALVKEG